MNWVITGSATHWSPVRCENNTWNNDNLISTGYSGPNCNEFCIIIEIFSFKKMYSIGQCKKDVTPLLKHWSYVFLALTRCIWLCWPEKCAPDWWGLKAKSLHYFWHQLYGLVQGRHNSSVLAMESFLHWPRVKLGWPRSLFLESS